jgi:hypothetical protein
MVPITRASPKRRDVWPVTLRNPRKRAKFGDDKDSESGSSTVGDSVLTVPSPPKKRKKLLPERRRSKGPKPPKGTVPIAPKPAAKRNGLSLETSQVSVRIEKVVAYIGENKVAEFHWNSRMKSWTDELGGRITVEELGKAELHYIMVRPFCGFQARSSLMKRKQYLLKMIIPAMVL